MASIIQTIKQLRSEGINGYFAIKYAEFAKDTPTMEEAYANLADRVTAVVSEGTILEVGPGPAFVSIEIARRIPQARIVGLDISETMIGIGRRNVAEAGLSERITFRLGNAVAMPFDGAEFERVVRVRYIMVRITEPNPGVHWAIESIRIRENRLFGLRKAIIGGLDK